MLPQQFLLGRQSRRGSRHFLSRRGCCNGQVRNGLGSIIYIFVERQRTGATRTGQVQVDGRRGGDAAAIRLADAKAVLANIATGTPQQRQRLNAEHTGGILFWAPPGVQAKKRPNLRRRKARRARKRTVLDNNFFFLEGPPGEGCIGAT